MNFIQLQKYRFFGHFKGFGITRTKKWLIYEGLKMREGIYGHWVVWLFILVCKG